ncbi:MAG: hypothetical protein ACRC18_07210 [Cetobacterium sp.]
MANYAIKDCFNLTFKELGQSTPFMTVDYLNSGSFSLESEKVVAKKKGMDAITFAGARTGTLTVESELSNTKMLGLALGGSVVGNKISITDVVPSKFFQVEGTFKVRTEEGKDIDCQITFYKVAPQPNSELNFSATDIASFSLTFDLLLDSANKLIDITIPETQTLSEK